MAIEISVECECGASLDGSLSKPFRYDEAIITVPLCDKCTKSEIEKAEQLAYDSGYKDAEDYFRNPVLGWNK